MCELEAADDPNLKPVVDAPRHPDDEPEPTPSWLQEIVLRCMAKDRAGRFASIAELVTALAPFARDQRMAAIVRERTRAMLAMAASIASVYPHMNHIGGDGFWLVRSRPVACGR